MSKGKCKVTFADRWSENDKFKSWLQKVEKCAYSTKCSICCKMFDNSNMGENALTSHMNEHCETAPSNSGS